jgi:hypothetical protein
MTTTVTPADAAPATDAPRLVKGALVRDKGKLVLKLDCSGLHAYLDSLGIEREATYRRFANAPATRNDTVDPAEHTIAPKFLCTYTVNAAGEKSSVIEADLMRFYSTPPTIEAMKRIAESIPEAALAVVAHYQPVEIAINVIGKKPTAR